MHVRSIAIFLFLFLPLFSFASQQVNKMSKADLQMQESISLKADTPFVKTYIMTMPQGDAWTDRFINFIIGMIGVVGGAFLSYYYTLRKGKEDMTFELYHEFNSLEMSRIRHDAWKLIKNHPGLDMQQLLDNDPDRTGNLLILARFYQKLYYNAINKRISDKLIFELFADLFYYWYYGFFEEKLIPLGWKNGDNLLELSKVLKAKISEEEHERLSSRQRLHARSEFYGERDAESS